MAASSAVAPTPAAFLRERGRTSSGEIPRLSTPPLPRRRSSVLSYASDTRQSVQSSASDYILPGLGVDQNKTGGSDDSSHWHSSPLAFALLPAVGGLLFTNGSAFITDILLLGLAAIFLNWSCRLPWQWYHSAQAISRASAPPAAIYTAQELKSGKRASKLHNSETAVQSDDSDGKDEPEEQEADADQELREEAADKLRMHEKLALISTFILPALAAYLLHVIRGQLSSNKSTVLVSDYNLTVFLLAAEIRPFRQLIKLITSNTLHLQRVANGLDLAGPDTEKAADIESRLELLEARVAEPITSTPLSPVQKEELSALSAELRKRYEPRIEAIERAIRRYEKRVTTLSIATEARLQAAELKLQDALSLAAVAAETSRRPSVVAASVSYLARVAVMPVELVAAALVWPVKMLEETARWALGGKKAKKRSGKTPVKARRVREEGAGMGMGMGMGEKKL